MAISIMLPRLSRWNYVSVCLSVCVCGVSYRATVILPTNRVSQHTAHKIFIYILALQYRSFLHYTAVSSR